MRSRAFHADRYGMPDLSLYHGFRAQLIADTIFLIYEVVRRDEVGQFHRVTTLSPLQNTCDGESIRFSYAHTIGCGEK